MKQTIIETIAMFFIVIAVTTLAYCDIELLRVEIGDAYNSNFLGLFIGINTYRDDHWQDLRYAVQDANSMYEFFSNNRAFNLDFGRKLIDPNKTTRDYILHTAFEELRIRNSSPDDVVIVYFSCHGTILQRNIPIIENGQNRSILHNVPYILTSDTKNYLIETSAISLSYVQEWFENLRSRHKILILDMCHTGSGKSQISPQFEGVRGVPYLYSDDHETDITLWASSKGEVAYEDDNLGHGIYTYYLLEGMKKMDNDSDGDGAIDILEAHRYAAQRTEKYSFSTRNSKQIPHCKLESSGMRPIYVFGRPITSKIGFEYPKEDIEFIVNDECKGTFSRPYNLSHGIYDIKCKMSNQIIYHNENKIIESGFNYIFRENGEIPDEFFLFIERGYHDFERDKVSKDLAPYCPTIGVSGYYNGIITSWLAVSGGLDFGQKQDLTQYSCRVGIKLTSSLFSNARIFFGPDCMYLFFRYGSDTIGDYLVEKEMHFFCPGLDMLLAYKFNKVLVMALGGRAYYFPYEIDSKKHTMILTQGFIAVGYAF
ncbi:MAG: caspase family protein [bacterium]